MAMEGRFAHWGRCYPWGMTEPQFNEWGVYIPCPLGERPNDWFANMMDDSGGRERNIRVECNEPDTPQQKN